MADQQSLPTVVMLDFLEKAEVESEILKGVANVVCLNATTQDQVPADIVRTIHVQKVF